MSRSRVLLPVLLCAALLAPAVPAQAASSLLCSGYAACERAGYDDFGYERNQRTSYWRMYTGTNCTNYVAYRLVTTNGMPNVRPKSGVGNARDWGTAMASITDQTPTVGSVAWWGRTGNHVAYVEKVASPTEIIVSESNWGRSFDHRRITKSGSGWPDGFIHFDDTRLVASSAPTVTGTGRVGEKLTAGTGTWSPKPTGFRYEWRADGTVVPGATGASFTPGPAHVGRKITVRVVATRASFPSASATSKAVTAREGVLRRTAPPSVSGTPKVDGTLTASPGSTTPSADVSYQWLADGEPGTGATGPRLTLRPELAGARIGVRTTSTRPGYVTLLGESAPSAPTAVGTLASTSRPAVDGKPVLDGLLTAAPGRWSRDDVTLDYQWLVAGRAVDGATARTFRPRLTDVGSSVSVRVTARRPGYADAARTSIATATVTAERFARTARPALRGTPKVGGLLTARTPDWTPRSTVVTHEWTVDGVVVRGATGSTFRLRPQDLGRTVSVAVTGTRPGYAPKRHTAVPTRPVGPGVIVADQPRLEGAAVPGRTLGIDLGSVPAGTTHTYQWLLDGRPADDGRGPTFTLEPRDLGKEVRVRVGYRRNGYATMTQKTAAAAVKAVSTIGSTTRVTGRDVKVAVRVRAAGVATPRGTVVVRVGGASRRLTLVEGRAVTTFRSVSRGKHAVAVEYRGSSITRSATATAPSVTVR